MDVLVGGGLAALAIYSAAKWQDKEKKKIQHTFRNLNYKVKDKEPILLKTYKADHYTLYTYHVPYGLVDDDKLQVLNKVLNKPVEVTFTKQKLHIMVYHKNLPTRINYAWEHTKGWTVPIGYTMSRLILHDFDKIPHMTISGMTRQGKTVLLKLIMSHLIETNADDVSFNIIDLKGGLEFGPYEKLKQVHSVASDVYEAYDVLQTIQAQIRSDMSDFKNKGYTNIVETPINRRSFIIVDEGAELTPSPHHSKLEKKIYQHCQYALSEIARVAGALGYRLIFATQYPTADTLPRQIKQNADAKISFRLPTEIASRVAIDEQGAEQLSNVGRAIYRTHDKHVIQVPYVSNKDIKERLGAHYVSPTNEEKSKGRTDIVEFG